jgi:hypothetical protein
MRGLALSGFGVVVKPKNPPKPKPLNTDQLAQAQQSGMLKYVLYGGGALIALGLGVMIWRSVTK